MRKLEYNNHTPFVLIIYVLIVLILLSIFGCSTPYYVGNKYTQCPTNNKGFWYERMGVKPSREYMRWGGK